MFGMKLMATRSSVYLVSILISLIITLISLGYQRDLNIVVEPGCTFAAECFSPSKVAGFPFGMLYDDPGISVSDSIGIEDDWRWLGFFLNWILYEIFTLLAMILVKVLPGKLLGSRGSVGATS